MTTSITSLNQLKQRRTEWAPWLAVVEEVLREAESSEWDTEFRVPTQQPASPLLNGATARVPFKPVRRLLERLTRIAATSQMPKLAALEFAAHDDCDLLALFKAALCGDNTQLGRLAANWGAEIALFQAVAHLLPVPFLRACARRVKQRPESWVEPYCPLCGSWPAFAEERGIERSRYFRCGRCGDQWHAHGLCCPFCGLRKHDALISLVPEKGRSRGAVEACSRCLGYVKVLTRLQGCSPATVLLDDLATVELDVAARSFGYARPSDTGFPLDVARLSSC